MNINEYNNLLNKYIKLLFEKNKLIMRDAPYIESRYLFHFGDLMVEELKHNKYIKELRIKQNIYENYFGLKREKEIKNIQHEIKKQTGILSKQICELEVKCETSKEVLSLREKYKDKKDKALKNNEEFDLDFKKGISTSIKIRLIIIKTMPT